MKKSLKFLKKNKIQKKYLSSVYPLIDQISKNIVNYDEQQLNTNHPNFKDYKYQQRRIELTRLCNNHQMGEKIPKIVYYDHENIIWKTVVQKLEPRLRKEAASIYITELDELFNKKIYNKNQIPQLNDVNDYLYEKTGFLIKPTTGLVSSKDFLYALSKKIFLCTQYIRHSSSPLYTPEPDIIHELIGHVPLFGNKNFAKLSQKIGEISTKLDSDHDIEKLSKCYWYSIEFGLMKEYDDIKVYGAGILSSVNEIDNIHNVPNVNWDIYQICNNNINITSIQDKYYIIDNFQELEQDISNYFGSNYTTISNFNKIKDKISKYF